MLGIMNDRFRKWLKVDALNRAWRTVLQGIATAALGAAGDSVLQAIQLAQHGGRFEWRAVAGTAAGAASTAAVMAVLAYIHRAKIDPSAIPSAQPPAPPVGNAPATTPPPAL
jgi:hypothetical protein